MKALVQKSIEKVTGCKAMRFALFLFALLALGVQKASATGYDIVQVATDGTITFTPGSLVTAIIVGAIAAVASAAALVVLAVGVRWMYRLIKAK